MAWGRASQRVHQMRQLSPEIRTVFERLAAAPETRDIETVRRDIATHLEAIEAAGHSNGLLPVDIAQALAAALNGLLDLLPSLESEHQRMAIAAARYFVSEQDAVPDTGGVLGLDDDIQVFNYVVERIGLFDRRLDL